MIKTVEQTTVADIFSINTSKVYRIPKYQREYTWGKNDWDALFGDVMENGSGYFLGSYICVNNSSLSETVLEVIDGQQRFSTLTLLLAALYEKLDSYSDDMDEEDKNDLANLRNEIAIKRRIQTANGRKKTEFKQRLFLQKQNMNDEDYSYILSSVGITSDQVAKPANFGNRRIAKAYKHFGKLIDEEIERRKEADPDCNETIAMFEMVSKFENAVLVGIEVDTNRDAYMLFESLNHRGVPLSALDLIKNTLIAQASNDADTDAAYDKWKQILTFIGQDDYAVQERFFRQYYNSFRDELNAPFKASDKKYYLGYLATRTTLLDIYEKMIKHDYSKLLDDLYEKAQNYAVIVNNTDEERKYTKAMKDLERISGAPSYILLLYLLSEQERLKLDDENINTVTGALVKFFVRRNVTDVPNTRRLTQLFIDIIADVKTKKGDKLVKAVIKKLIEVSAPDAVFEEKLRGPLYDENPEATRFILCSIESSHQTKEIYTELWSRDSSNKYIWTIEHIFPEGENIPKAWVDMIADGDKDLAKTYRGDYVHTLGNLTITGYNQNLSNMSFEQKKDRKSKDKKKEMGYRNGLFLNKDVVKEDIWTINKIQKRTDKIVGILLKMYGWDVD